MVRQCALKKWGTIARCVQLALDLETILIWGWDLDLYNSVGGPGGKSRSKDADIMDEAIKDSGWWLGLTALNLLFKALRQAMDWARGCPCHGPFFSQSVPAFVKRLWKTCPLRGMRLAEVAGGYVLEMFVTFAHSARQTF